jgi:hypothetical protein
MSAEFEGQVTKRSKTQVSSFYERVASELEALANDIKVANAVDLKLFHSLRKKARDIRAGADNVAVKLSEEVTRH